MTNNVFSLAEHQTVVSHSIYIYVTVYKERANKTPWVQSSVEILQCIQSEGIPPIHKHIGVCVQTQITVSLSF